MGPPGRGAEPKNLSKQQKPYFLFGAVPKKLFYLIFGFFGRPNFGVQPCWRVPFLRVRGSAPDGVDPVRSHTCVLIVGSAGKRVLGTIVLDGVLWVAVAWVQSPPSLRVGGMMAIGGEV